MSTGKNVIAITDLDNQKQALSRRRQTHNIGNCISGMAYDKPTQIIL